jgi:hypothetical protein
MANPMILFDGPGPLPVSATFNSPSDGDIYFILSGTAWTESAATMTGVALYLDGALIGKPALLFANVNSSHAALRTTLIPYTGLKQGPHKIVIQPSTSATITDSNDYFQVSLVY